MSLKNKTKQNDQEKRKKKTPPAGVEAQTFGMQRLRVIYCATTSND